MALSEYFPRYKEMKCACCQATDQPANVLVTEDGVPYPIHNRCFGTSDPLIPGRDYYAQLQMMVLEDGE